MAPKAKRSTPSSTLLSTTPTKKPVASSNPDPTLKLDFTHRGAPLFKLSHTLLSTQYGLSSNHYVATPYLRAAEIVGPISIGHREQAYLSMTSSGRRTGGVIRPPNVVYLLHQAPTTSIPLNPLGASGWQVVPAPV